MNNLETLNDNRTGHVADSIMDTKNVLPMDQEKQSARSIFDPEKLRLSQDFPSLVGVKKAVVTIPVRKPNRQEFIRVNPDEGMRLETAVLELKEDRETYLVSPALWSELPDEIVPKVLFATINRQRVFTLWPIRLPGSDGRIDEWNRSALEAAKMAMKSWVRVAANMSLGGYDIFEALGDFGEPEWPELSFQKILEISFRDKFIQDVNHPVIRRLRGEV
jgi:hypothetical protein